MTPRIKATFEVTAVQDAVNEERWALYIGPVRIVNGYSQPMFSCDFAVGGTRALAEAVMTAFEQAQADENHIVRLEAATAKLERLIAHADTLLDQQRDAFDGEAG